MSTRNSYYMTIHRVWICYNKFFLECPFQQLNHIFVSVFQSLVFFLFTSKACPRVTHKRKKHYCCCACKKESIHNKHEHFAQYFPPSPTIPETRSYDDNDDGCVFKIFSPLSIILFTWTNMWTSRTILVWWTGRDVTLSAQPTFFAETAATDVWTRCSIVAGTGLCTVYTIGAKWTFILTLKSSVCWHEITVNIWTESEQWTFQALCHWKKRIQIYMNDQILDHVMQTWKNYLVYAMKFCMHLHLNFESLFIKQKSAKNSHLIANITWRTFTAASFVVTSCRVVAVTLFRTIDAPSTLRTGVCTNISLKIL